MSLNIPEGSISPYKKELQNVFSELEVEAQKNPLLEPHIAPLRSAIKMRVRNPRHRVSSDEFIGLSETMNVLFYASEDFKTFKDKPDEITVLQKKLEDIHTV